MAFNVTVTSKPKGGAKGQFRCEVIGDGLSFTPRKGESFEVRCGSDAKYLGKNRFQIALDDHRLTVIVSEFARYQNRLAKDLAAFVNGSGSAPILEEYSLQWYFFLLTALPVGIPVITLGGAIPAGIGAGLAASCFAVAQKEEWSIGRRVLAALGLVAAGYVALFMLLVMAS